MKIPRRIKKHNRKFIFVKRYPKFVMYQDFLAGYKECFSFHELGLIKNEERVHNVTPNRVKL